MLSLPENYKPIILIPLILYLSFCFVLAEINPFNWEWKLRFYLLLSIVIVFIIYYGKTFIDNENN